MSRVVCNVVLVVFAMGAVAACKSQEKREAELQERVRVARDAGDLLRVGDLNANDGGVDASAAAPVDPWKRALDESVQRALCDVDAGPVYLLNDHVFETSCRTLVQRRHPDATFPYGFGSVRGTCKRTLISRATVRGSMRAYDCTFDPLTGEVVFAGLLYTNPFVDGG